MITSSKSNDNPVLRAAICQKIRDKGALTFANFMEMALYYPGEGYYTNRTGLIGARGDFYTSPHLTPVFGELIARQITEMWQRLGQPELFTIVEVGAGQGILAGDILSQLYHANPDLWPAIDYRIVEISETLQKAQAHRIKVLPDGAELLNRVKWNSWQDFEPESITGCVFSNELVDAFPVHLVQVENGALQEIYVKLDEIEAFIEESGPLSNPALEEFFKNLGISIADYEEGYRTEVNLRGPEWIKQVAGLINRGYLLTIDYGYEASSRYHPRRSSGTLQCYYQHTINPNPYQNIGRQDITAHVDFTGLALAGEKAGIAKLGLTSQAIFLGSLGIGDLLVKLSTPGYGDSNGLKPDEILSKREAIHKLLMPEGMGNFKVLLQGKNVPSEPPLQGFSLSI